MATMSEEYLIRNCAPTLAGIKTGSLFTCPYSCKAEVISSLRGLNQSFYQKGCGYCRCVFPKIGH